jgi:hypothetical protein
MMEIRRMHASKTMLENTAFKNLDKAIEIYAQAIYQLTR